MSIPRSVIVGSFFFALMRLVEGILIFPAFYSPIFLCSWPAAYPAPSLLLEEVKLNDMLFFEGPLARASFSRSTPTICVLELGSPLASWFSHHLRFLSIECFFLIPYPGQQHVKNPGFGSFRIPLHFHKTSAVSQLPPAYHIPRLALMNTSLASKLLRTSVIARGLIPYRFFSKSLSMTILPPPPFFPPTRV